MATRKKSPKQEDFEDPQVAEPSDDDAYDDELEFEAADPEDEDSEPGDDEEEESGALSADEKIVQLKTEVEQALFARKPVSAAAMAAEEVYVGVDNVVGVGIGTPERDFESIGDEGPGGHVLNVYVAEPASMEEVRAAVFDGFGVQAVGDDRVPVNVICTGPIDALSHRHRARPAPGGISVGHFRITAGTLGCLALGRSGARRRRILMLSNNHVLANSNNAARGDNIIQPGRADGGVNSRDRIAILERFVRIDFAGRPNFVDCATGWCWQRLVRRELVYRSGGQWRFFRISSRPRGCRVGMIVGKSGRTTQLTAGRITDCNASIRVNYGNGRVGNFRDQITVRGLRGDFSRGGDSGAVVWSYDTRRNPVGLLFAGGSGFTFANKMPRVLAALDINLRT